MSCQELFVAALAILLVGGCTTPLTMPTPTPLHGYAAQIEQAKQKWASQGIQSYKISLEFYENFVANIQTHRTVTVQDGKVTQATCGSEGCPIFDLQRVFTVEDLFWVAEGGSLPKDYGPTPEATRPPELATTIENCLQGLIFNDTYGYPEFVNVDCPGWADEENWVRVTSFEVIDQ